MKNVVEGILKSAYKNLYPKDQFNRNSPILTVHTWKKQ